MKKFIECYIPVTTCNFRCHYCYITQARQFDNALPTFNYDAEYMAKALSQKRLGGVCHLNLCGDGETLLPPEVPKIIRALLEEGHYLMIVTNGSMTKRIEEILKFPSDILKRLCFKMSFHYLELKRLNKLNDFFENVNKIKKSSASFTVEITPNDKLVPYIDEIQELGLKYLGAPFHITIARKDTDSRIPILSNYNIDEYKDIWGTFNSELFKFKLPLYYQKRKEFCYAGEWSAVLNLNTGELKQCYFGKYLDNIYKDIEKPIRFLPVGTGCELSHCYNAHSFLSLGSIPEMNTPKYAELRNRLCSDKTEWLKSSMKEFFSRKLKDYNDEYNNEDKKKIMKKNRVLKYKWFIKRVKYKIFNSLMRK